MIYTIYKVTNTINNKIYIGFDSDWPKRIKTHKSDYKRKNKLCRFYSAIIHYGWDNFLWEPIYQSKNKNHTLNEMENYFIEEYRTYIGFEDCNGYNMTLGGDGALGSNIKTFRFYYNNEIVEITNIWEFCKGTNLSPQTLYAVSYGAQLSYKGFININYPNYILKKDRIYKFQTPSGENIEINNIEKYCQENNIDAHALRAVCSGKRKSYKGFHQYQYTEQLKYYIYSFNNKNVEILNIKQYSKENGLCSQAMYDLKNGKLKSYKGWKYIKYVIKEKGA